jgi:integrase
MVTDPPYGVNYDAYINPAGIAEDRKGFLFRTARGHNGSVLSDKPMSQPDAWRMIRRRAATAGIAAEIGCHTFRATGITAYLANGGALEHAQEMAAHESPRTTKLYDRTDSIPSTTLRDLRDRALIATLTYSFRMIRRRAATAGIAAEIGCHTFRATGITAYPANGGALKHGAGNGRAREPAHDQALRPDERTAYAGRGGKNSTLKHALLKSPI